jgi:hypothetical protein
MIMSELCEYCGEFLEDDVIGVFDAVILYDRRRNVQYAHHHGAQKYYCYACFQMWIHDISLMLVAPQYAEENEVELDQAYEELTDMLDTASVEDALLSDHFEFEPTTCGVCSGFIAKNDVVVVIQRGRFAGISFRQSPPCTGHSADTYVCNECLNYHPLT